MGYLEFYTFRAHPPTPPRPRCTASPPSLACSRPCCTKRYTTRAVGAPTSARTPCSSSRTPRRWRGLGNSSGWRARSSGTCRGCCAKAANAAATAPEQAQLRKRDGLGGWPDNDRLVVGVCVHRMLLKNVAIGPHRGRPSGGGPGAGGGPRGVPRRAPASASPPGRGADRPVAGERRPAAAAQ